jgi:hypothetical protein
LVEQVWPEANVAEVCFGPCLGPQPLFDGAPPPEPQSGPADPRRRSRKVVRPFRGLIDNWSRGIGDRFTFVLQHLRQLKQVHTLTHPAKMGARGTGEDVVEDGD